MRVLPPLLQNLLRRDEINFNIGNEVLLYSCNKQIVCKYDFQKFAISGLGFSYHPKSGDKNRQS